MKILFDHPWPFSLAHGGFQIQIEQTHAALQRAGVPVEYLRWWDADQSGDIIHFFGRPSGGYIDLAHKKGMKVVVAELLTGLGSRSSLARKFQKTLMSGADALLPKSFTSKMSWEVYQKADAFVALTRWEAYLMRSMFDADPARVHVVGNGVEPVFFRPHQGGTHLVSTAVIHPRKRVLELAVAAASARVPIWIIGKPYADSDSYHQEFLKFQRQHAEWVRYEGAISDRARLAEIYSTSRGFVLISTQESLSLSALEASAAGCSLLLSDLPWAKETFGDRATYVSPSAAPSALAAALAAFSNQSLSPGPCYTPPTWDDIATSLQELYGKILASPI